jgi:hypothetical protein
VGDSPIPAVVLAPTCVRRCEPNVPPSSLILRCAALKNYDPSKDKRFNGTFRLPVPPRPTMRLCVLGHEQHCTEAKALGIDALSADDLKKFNKNQKMVKKMGACLASAAVVSAIAALVCRTNVLFRECSLTFTVASLIHPQLLPAL